MVIMMQNLAKMTSIANKNIKNSWKIINIVFSVSCEHFFNFKVTIKFAGPFSHVRIIVVIFFL